MIPALIAVAVVVVAQMLSGDSEIDSETTLTTVPGSSTSAPATTDVITTEPPDVTQAPTTTAVPTTSGAPTTTEAEDPSALATPALAAAGADLVWLDTATGAVEVAHGVLFEAAYPTRLALGVDGERAYYQLFYEDYWFSCETASGQVMVLDIASGSSTEIARGLPALSPDGSRLAYLTSDECQPDPDEPQFFVAVFDTLVISDVDGSELSRYPVAGEGSEALVNLVWADDDVVLVLDESGTTYEVTADVAPPQAVQSFPTRDLPTIYLLAVVDGLGIGATLEATGSGPLSWVDLVTGEAAPIPNVPQSVGYAMGVSAEGELIVGVDGRVLVDLDPVTGESEHVHELESVAAIDW
ncbi:hypothetical protein BH23ACT5_BH23ACT5_08400 [soil metagenome]